MGKPSKKAMMYMKNKGSVSSSAMPKKKMKVMSKSKAAKQASKGKDMGKKGKNFSKIASKAGKEYGSKTAGKKVAGSIFQNMRKKGTL